MAKAVKKDAKELQIEFESGDLTIPDLVASELLKSDSVEFAGVQKDHPQTGKPLLVVKSKRSAKTDLLKAIEDLDSGFKSLKEQLSKKK